MYQKLFNYEFKVTWILKLDQYNIKPTGGRGMQHRGGRQVRDSVRDRVHHPVPDCLPAGPVRPASLWEG